MAWTSVELQDLKSLISGRQIIGGNASIQGITLTTSISDHEEVIPSSVGRTRPPNFTDSTRRTEANKARQGQALPRSGRFVRTNEFRRRIHAWVDCRGGSQRMKFWTVTFPLGTPDRLAMKAFNILLTRWRKAVPDLNYSWAAERQDNKTLHFHAVSDTYVNVKLLNSWMRTTLINMGAQIPWTYAGQSQRYNGITLSPPVYSRTGMENYLVKYLSKAMNAGISQPWHMSRSIAHICTRARIDHHTVVEVVAQEHTRKSGTRDKVKLLVEDQFIYIPLPSRVNPRIADRLLIHNRSSWQRCSPSFRSRSPVLHVESLRVHPSPTARTGVGVQLPLISVPRTIWNPRGRPFLGLNGRGQPRGPVPVVSSG